MIKILNWSVITFVRVIVRSVCDCFAEACLFTPNFKILFHFEAAFKKIINSQVFGTARRLASCCEGGNGTSDCAVFALSSRGGVEDEERDYLSRSQH